MTVQDDAALEAETRAILEAAGARRVRVEGAGDHWLVSAHFGSTQRLGHTGISAETSYDPRDLARRLIAREGAPHTPALSEDEDPDLGAEMLAAEDEAGENPGEDESTENVHSDAGESPALGEPGDAERDGDGEAAGAYPGIAILESELERRRNQVLRMISDAKRNRLVVACDRSREDWLAEQAQRYIALGALGGDIPDETRSAYTEFCALKDRKEAIQREALQREDAAAVADMDQLQNIAVGMEQGWP